MEIPLGQPLIAQMLPRPHAEVILEIPRGPSKGSVHGLQVDPHGIFNGRVGMEAHDVTGMFPVHEVRVALSEKM